MEKPAEVKFPVHELIGNRWSPVGFSNRRVEPDKLGSLLEAARWAASSYNEQPWRFIVATKGDGDNFERLLQCLVEGNVMWAQQAPVLMIACTSLNFTRNGKPNRHAFHDLGLALGNLVLQATAVGLSVHQMAGFSPERARETLGIPNGFEAVTALAVGYAAESDSLPDPLKTRDTAPRSRKPLQEIAFSPLWGTPVQLPE